MSPLLGTVSLKSKGGQAAGYAWSKADASCVYDALPAGVGLAITRLRRTETRGLSQAGSGGRACSQLDDEIRIRWPILTSGTNLGRKLPTKLRNVTASVPLKTFCKTGISSSMLFRTFSTSAGMVAALVHVKLKMSKAREC